LTILVDNVLIRVFSALWKLLNKTFCKEGLDVIRSFLRIFY
jgi:hypothetical protein